MNFDGVLEKLACVNGGSEFDFVVNMAGRRFLVDKVNWYKPKTILQIGTYLGTAALFLAAAAQEYGGRVVSVDIMDVNADDGPWSKTPSHGRPRDAAIEVGLDIDFVVDDSVGFLTKYPSVYDMAFLDGDHRHTTVYKELNLLRVNGVILLHDVFSEDMDIGPGWRKPIRGPWLAMKQFSEERGAVVESVRNYGSEMVRMGIVHGGSHGSKRTR